LKLNLLKKIFKPLLFGIKLISGSVPSPLERVRERWFVSIFDAPSP
jgi:hypothetical protein